MGRVVVEVMPKPEILDPQGKAVVGALPRLGITAFTGVRQGKRFELDVDGPVTPDILAAARDAATRLLSNPIIEDVVRVADSGVPASPRGQACGVVGQGAGVPASPRREASGVVGQGAGVPATPPGVAGGEAVGQGAGDGQ